MTRIFLLLLVAVMALPNVSASPLPLDLRIHRDNMNVIRLHCLNISGQSLSISATFYLNNTVLNAANFRSFEATSTQQDMVTFLIKQELEGSYSCSVSNQWSNATLLIVFPTRARVEPKTFYAVVGERARLDCVVSPGALLKQYAVTWLNGTLPIYRQARSSNLTQFTDRRYHLDPMTLSLLIDNVQFSDNLTDYHCEMSVQDPHSMNTHIYEVARNVNISLVVLAMPTITRKPEAKVVAEGLNVLYSCYAYGFPVPKISWEHNGGIVAANHADFLIDTTEDKESMTTKSNLRILSVDVQKTGHVKCIVHATAPIDSTIVFNNATASAPLTVLGTLNHLDVLISTDGDVIFLMKLPVMYRRPIRIFFKYVNVGDPNRWYNRTSDVAFLNTTKIQYVEFSSQVAYEQFTVQVRLESEGVFGNPYDAPGMYDKNRITLCDNAVGKDTALIIGLVPTSLLFIIIILLIALIIIIICEGVKIIAKAVPDEKKRTVADGEEKDITVMVTEFCKHSVVGEYLYGPLVKRRLKYKSNSQS